MQVRDVMTRKVISIAAGDTVLSAVNTMLQNRISGLPVIDAQSNLVGMVTEGDFLRRSEIGTQRRRPKWLEFLVGPGRLAEEYVHASGRKVEEVMTADPVTVSEDDSLETVVELMERRHIKRLPVVRDGKMVGIVSRANLMLALVSLARDKQTPAGGDAAIRERVLAAFENQRWAPQVNVVVKNGVADLWGTIMDERERRTCLIMAENVGGVTEVHDHLVWVEPMSGMAFPSSEDEANLRKEAQNARTLIAVPSGPSSNFAGGLCLTLLPPPHRSQRARGSCIFDVAAAARDKRGSALAARTKRPGLCPRQLFALPFGRQSERKPAQRSRRRSAPCIAAIPSRACRNRLPKASSPGIRRCPSSGSIPGRSLT